MPPMGCVVWMARNKIVFPVPPSAFKRGLPHVPVVKLHGHMPSKSG